MIPVYQPFLPKNKEPFKYAYETMEAGWISSIASPGSNLEKTKEKLQEMFGIKHVILTCNGTASCHLGALSLKYLYPEIKNIIVPQSVFVAAINAFLLDKNYKLHAVDIDLTTTNYDLELLDEKIISFKGEQIAVLVVHNMGSVINVPELQRKYPNTIFLEDNCEGFLGKYEDKYTGTISLCSAVSGYSNKSIAAGEMGLYFTNNDDLYDYCFQYICQGQAPGKRFHHDIYGLNYKVSNIQAGIYLRQLELMSEIVSLKENIFKKYHNKFSEMPEINQLINAPNTSSSNWMKTIVIDGKLAKGFEHADQYFRSQGVEPRSLFTQLSKHKYLNNNPLIDIGSEEKAKELYHRAIVLPSYPDLTEEDQTHVINTVKNYIQELKKK